MKRSTFLAVILAALAAPLLVQCRRVDMHTALWASPPANGGVSRLYPTGPITGNGNIGVSCGSVNNSVQLYMTVHGMWIIGTDTAPRVFDDLGAPQPALGNNTDPYVTPAGGVIGGLTISSTEFADNSTGSVRWSAAQYLNNGTIVMDLSNAATDAGTRIVAFAAATVQLVIVNVFNTGSADLPLTLELWTNNNVLNIPVSAGCDAASSDCSAYNSSWAPRQWVRKYSGVLDVIVFPVTGVLVMDLITPQPFLDAATTAITQTIVPTKSWVNGTVVDTTTLAVATTTTLRAAGAPLMLAVAALASEDPGVPPADPFNVAVQRLEANASSAAAVASVAAAHSAWWDAFWSASELRLDAGAAIAEAFWYGSMYALGASSRAGQIAPDLFSPFRTSDYMGWRSCYTSDYNMQATFWAAFSANHPELSLSYFDFLATQLAYGGPFRDAAAMNCSGGIHLSVDLAPWGRRMGIDYGPANGTSIPFDWGIHANAIFAALNYVNYYESTLDLQFVNDTAWAFLVPAVKFWNCTLTRVAVPAAPDGYEYWDFDDCAGDENCPVPAPQRVNSVWTLTYLRRVLAHMIEVAPLIGREVAPEWSDMLAHLPGVQTTFAAHNKTTPPVPVLAWYSSNWTGFTRQNDNVMPLFPGNVLSLSNDNGTLLQAARNSFDFTSWGQSNQFCWVYAAAAHAGYNATAILDEFQTLLQSVMQINYLATYGGACSDTLGAPQYLMDALLQGQEGFIRLFPAWPSQLDASFTMLRVRNAHLVSAEYTAATGTIANVNVTSSQGADIGLINPWPQATSQQVVVCDVSTSALSDHVISGCAAGVPVNVTWSTAPGTQQPAQQLLTWPSTTGHTYVINLTA